ncbi:phage holin family protein [Enterobacter kobei]
MDANAIVCLLIMVRLMFFRKEGKRHRLSVAVLAYRYGNKLHFSWIADS